LFCAAILAVPLAQLAASASIWIALPGRAILGAPYELINRGLPWAPLSLRRRRLAERAFSIAHFRIFSACFSLIMPNAGF